MKLPLNKRAQKAAQQNAPYFMDVHLGTMDGSVRRVEKKLVGNESLMTINHQNDDIIKSAKDKLNVAFHENDSEPTPGGDFFLFSERGPAQPIIVRRGSPPRRRSKFNNPQALRRARHVR